MRTMDSTEPRQRPDRLPPAATRLQIRQHNDPELAHFFNEFRVDYKLVGDHLFIIRRRGSDVAAGPGDWLVARPDGGVDVELGDYAMRARQPQRRPGAPAR
jgi:hypothetical protein